MIGDESRASLFCTMSARSFTYLCIVVRPTYQTKPRYTSLSTVQGGKSLKLRSAKALSVTTAQTSSLPVNLPPDHMSLGWYLERIFYPGRLKPRRQPDLPKGFDKTAPSSSNMAANVTGTLQEVARSNVSSANTTTSALTALLSQDEPGRSTLVGLLIAIFTILPSVLYWMVTFTTITLPTWMFTLLSTSLTLTVNMTTLLLILVFFVSTISWIVRYRFLNMYSRLPPEPQRKEPQVEVFPDTQEADSKPGLANYLDEFLSAIKVFGYLERPVFHELTRTMQTRKLIAGETLLLEEEKGFCLVVDGLVQIFVKSNRPNDDGDRGAEDDEDDVFTSVEDDGRSHGNQGYSLLTEVKNGAPMSSLFSILSLFTEDVKLRHDEKEESVPGSAFPSHDHSGAATPGSAMASPEFMSPLKSTLTREDSNGMPGRQAVPPFSLDPNQDSRPTSRAHHRDARQEQREQSKKYASAHPDIVARASVDTTIAVIPATAFHRLTRLYPKATAHIVQVILTRLQRVTLATGHAYLGLTSEVLRTESLMDRYTSYDLPDFLRGDALERLKDKFRKVCARDILHFSFTFANGPTGTRAHRPTGAQQGNCPAQPAFWERTEV